MRASVMLALSLVACGGASDAPDGDAPDPHAGHAHHDHAHHAEAPPAAPLPGGSIYQIDASFTDQSGEAVRLADLAGRPTHIALVFTHCSNVCPRLVADIARIEDGLGERADDVRFVLLSIDPARDTPERLRAFADERGLDLKRWTLLRGDDRDVRMVAAALGVQYRAIADGDFAHSNLVTLLDARGVVVHRQEGLGAEPDAAVQATRALLR